MSKNVKKQSNKTPENVSQWASDAFQALEKALIAFDVDYPEPDDEEHLELIGYAADLAAAARGVTDEARIDEADEFAVDNVLNDLDDSAETEQDSDFSEETTGPQYNLLFLICYLDVHVAFGLLDETMLSSVMDHLVDNFDLVAD